MKRRSICKALLAAAMLLLAIVAVPPVHAESGCHQGPDTSVTEPPKK